MTHAAHSPAPVVRAMQPSDLDAVVQIHRSAFKGFFLTRMGPRFLRAYYQAVLDFPSSIALVAGNPADADAPASGFAVGFRDPQGFYAFFSERRRRLIGAMILAVLRDPRLVAQILRNMRRVETQARQYNGAVELSSIAVQGQGKGLGGVLLTHFEQQAREGSATRIVLTTDADGNDGVRRFYEQRGFVLEDTETRGTRRLCHYARSLG